MRRRMTIAALLTVALIAAGCSGGHKSARASSQDAATYNHNHQRAYVPPVDNTEIRNYNQAQRLYNDPSTIIWCTHAWPVASSPLVTTPIAGKLTSSTTSYFAPDWLDDQGSDGVGVRSNYSVDGLYHPNPPQYRYGFTPGGQYVDYFNMPTYCTTSLTKFQRQATRVSVAVDPGVTAAQGRAEAALRRGDKAGAQHILEQALGGGQ